MAMLFDLFSLCAFGRSLRVSLLQIGLESRYLLIDARNVLLDDECEFLKKDGKKTSVIRIT
jgi:hypothetical protein